MKNCLFVGSFNPITKTHLEIAKDLLNDNIIDYIYFLPVNSKKTNLVSINNRINMINLTIQSKMQVLNIYNFQQEGLFNYLILEKIKKLHNITHLVMGSDLFLNLETFYKYEEILKNYNLIIIKRDNIDIVNLISNKYKLYSSKIKIINKDYLGSSTLARTELKFNKNDNLDLKVFNYIKENNLYN